MAGPESWPQASPTLGEQGDVVAVVAALEGVDEGSAAVVADVAGFTVLGDEAGDLGARQTGDLLDVPLDEARSGLGEPVVVLELDQRSRG